MDFRAPGADEIAEVQQLNGLFLLLIQEAAAGGQAALGFPIGLRTSIAGLHQDDLHRIAAAPRSLFTLSLTVSPLPSSSPSTAWEAARRAFALAALYGAWTAARHSNAVARTLYGLGSLPVRQLRLLRVADLVNLSVSVDVATCAFDSAPSMWQSLLSSSSEPLPRTLVLALISASRGADAVNQPRTAQVSVAG